MLKDLPEGNYRFIALDVETAGGDSASICQIGIACVKASGEITTWKTYIDPQTPFAPFNIELHGIGPETVKGAPTFAQAWPQLAPLLEAHPMVQHSRFDEAAINAACRAAALPRPRLEWTDSVTVARKAWPEFKGNGGHGLGHLKQALGLHFKHHDAGEDARAAAQVILQAQEVLGDQFAKAAPRLVNFQLRLPL